MHHKHLQGCVPDKLRPNSAFYVTSENQTALRKQCPAADTMIGNLLFQSKLRVAEAPQVAFQDPTEVQMAELVSSSESKPSRAYF